MRGTLVIVFVAAAAVVTAGALQGGLLGTAIAVVAALAVGGLAWLSGMRERSADAHAAPEPR